MYKVHRQVPGVYQVLTFVVVLGCQNFFLEDLSSEEENQAHMVLLEWLVGLNTT